MIYCWALLPIARRDLATFAAASHRGPANLRPIDGRGCATAPDRGIRPGFRDNIGHPFHMSPGRAERLAARVLDLFRERHLFVRSGGDVRGLVLTSRRQLALAAIAGACALWLGVSTVAMLAGAVSHDKGETAAAQTQAKYERWIADRQARLDSALAQLDAPANSAVVLAGALEKRHAALAMLLTQAQGIPGALQALAPVLLHPVRPAGGSPAQRIAAVQVDQERLIEAAGSFAKNRADRLR